MDRCQATALAKTVRVGALSLPAQVYVQQPREGAHAPFDRAQANVDWKRRVRVNHPGFYFHGSGDNVVRNAELDGRGTHSKAQVAYAGAPSRKIPFRLGGTLDWGASHRHR